MVLLLIPINRALAGRIEAASVTMMAHKDARMRRTGELLRGIRQIKAAAWERCFVSRVGPPCRRGCSCCGGSTCNQCLLFNRLANRNDVVRCRMQQLLLAWKHRIHSPCAAECCC